MLRRLHVNFNLIFLGGLHKSMKTSVYKSIMQKSVWEAQSTTVATTPSPSSSSLWSLAQ